MIYEMGKISNSGKVWETVWSSIDYPDNIDLSISGDFRHSRNILSVTIRVGIGFPIIGFSSPLK